ncbi:MAG TPA: hypothetical protein VK447_01335 [Myxococcaceae bacterium]|nr:hypothetical protein [Myxococcaceae bacterium]
MLARMFFLGAAEGGGSRIEEGRSRRGSIALLVLALVSGGASCRAVEEHRKARLADRARDIIRKALLDWYT